jgi:RNA polymerase sigma-70 factor (TIGR02943 family)
MVCFNLHLGDKRLSTSYQNSSDDHLSKQAHLLPEDWVDAYGDLLYRYALMRLRDPSEAEEVVQETFLAGIRHAGQFDGKGAQQAWLLGILKRKVIDTVRKRQRQDRYLAQDALDFTALLFDESGHWRAGLIPSIGPDDFVETSELWQVVRDCLSAIPQTQADAFVLSVMEDMAPEQICEELGITTDNLWVRLHRARLGLAKCVSSKWLEVGRG